MSPKPRAIIAVLTCEAISYSMWAGWHLVLPVGSCWWGPPDSWQSEQWAGHSWVLADCSYAVCCTAGSGHWCILLGCCLSHWIHSLRSTLYSRNNTMLFWANNMRLYLTCTCCINYCKGLYESPLNNWLVNYIQPLYYDTPKWSLIKPRVSSSC